MHQHCFVCITGFLHVIINEWTAMKMVIIYENKQNGTQFMVDYNITDMYFMNTVN